jgi:hypothetical protein
LNFYSHHIGDYKSATAHLSDLEDLAYRRLLEMYYDTEQPLPNDFEFLARRTRCQTETISIVLNDFFKLGEDGLWHQSRCDKEIASYQAMRQGGKDGADKRWGKGAYAPLMPPLSPPITHPNANHEPLTINHKPKNTETQKSAAPPFVLPDWINSSHWETWHSTAKRKKATPEQKQMAVDKLAAWRNAGEDFAVALENAAIGGNQGLFLPNKPFAKTSTGETPYQKSMRERMSEFAPGIARRAPGQEFTDLESINVVAITRN